MNVKRNTILNTGEKLGFHGDYNSPGAWGEKKVLVARIYEYVYIETKNNTYISSERTDLDLAILAVREHSGIVQGINSFYNGTHLLIVHRYPDGDWDYSDPNVFIFGLEYEGLSEITSTWHKNAMLLSTAAIMGVMSEKKKSEMGNFFEKYEEI